MALVGKTCFPVFDPELKMLNGGLKTLPRTIRGPRWKDLFSGLRTTEMVLQSGDPFQDVPPRRSQRKMAREVGTLFGPKRDFILEINTLVGI